MSGWSLINEVKAWFSTADDQRLKVQVSNDEAIDVNCNIPEGKTLAAGESISAVKALYSNGTNVFLGDADTDFQNASIVGISITAILAF